MDRSTLSASLPAYNDFQHPAQYQPHQQQHQHQLQHSHTHQPAQPDVASSLDALKVFLATAPTRWNSHPQPAQPFQHANLRRLQLPNQDFVSCVLWNGRYFITGTDIVRALLLRFEAFGAFIPFRPLAS